jgi:hypothetical protein
LKKRTKKLLQRNAGSVVAKRGKSRAIPELALHDYPDDVRIAVQALALTLGKQAPISERLIGNLQCVEACLPGHRVTLAHLLSSDHPTGRSAFELSIAGARTDGKWTFRPGHLSKLVAQAQQT